MHRVSESLAGRASHLTLRPMTRRERSGEGAGGLWEELVHTPDDRWLDLLAAQPDEPEDWRAPARSGGFPTPAVHLAQDEAGTVWFDGYVRTYLAAFVKQRPPPYLCGPRGRRSPAIRRY